MEIFLILFITILAIFSFAGLYFTYMLINRKIYNEKELLNSCKWYIEYGITKCDILKKKIKQQEHQIKIMELVEKGCLLNNIEINRKQYSFDKKYKGHVLIGEYSDELAKDIRMIVRSFGVSVDVVKYRDDIIYKIDNEEEFDLIITNIKYKEGMTNDVFIETINERSKNDSIPPIIVVQTSSNDKEKNKLIELSGYDDYIENPLNPFELEKIFEKYLIDKNNKKN